MEDLLTAFGKSSISSDKFIAKKYYKCNGRTDVLNREKRRIQLLEDCKRKRDILLNEKRGLINDEFNEGEDWMDWQEGGKKHHKKWINRNCKNQLMLSEWLLDRPHDLDTTWTCVLCPEGRRSLVIAKKGCTRAYHKNGLLLAKFKSILPNGSSNNRTTQGTGPIILDCIWNQSTKQLFALDVLHWNKMPLLNCDAQFRLYWLSSKLMEVKNSSTVQEGVYDVYLPPHCALGNLPTTLSEHHPSQVDGVLFYHNQAPYLSGSTPLVGWLKPFMLPERLGLDVPPEYLALKPDSYVDLEEWVAKVSHAHTRSPRRKKHQEMEISDSQETEVLKDSTEGLEHIPES